MSDFVPLGERLAPDTVARLEQAAKNRLATADILRRKGAELAAVYMFGYVAEICLSAAYFRSAGFSAHQPIDRDTRRRRMAQARQRNLMNSDPHPLVGWARFLQSQRALLGGLTPQDEQRLREAVNKAILIYNYWRPELRYKTVEITDPQLHEVHKAAHWLFDSQKQL